MKKDRHITESLNAMSQDIDKKSVLEMLNIFNAEDDLVIKAVKKSLTDIHDIINTIVHSMKMGGRLFYVGAGTSGRLGVIDAAECQPTFSVDSEMIQGIIAGGEEAMFRSIENAEDSLYASSKLKGEFFIRKNFKEANILKPSVIYSVDDKFTTSFMRILALSPIFPLYYNGSTLFRPIYISDLTEIIYQMIEKNIKSTIMECVGPEEISLKNILKRLSKLIDKKRLLIPIPLSIAKLSAIFFQFFPRPLITLDQLKLLKYHNIPTGKYKTNFDFKMPSATYFEDEVKKYSFMWKDGGQFSTTKETKN